MMQFEVAARSHTGYRRTGNEDSGYAGSSLVLVADGVGGAAAGEVASAAAATIVADLALRTTPVVAGKDPAAVLAEAVDRSTAALRAHVAAHPEVGGLGTTLTALLTDGTRCGLVHLGDSRAYLWRAGRLHRLTRDHSWAQAMVDGGHLSHDQAARSPYARRLARWIGAEDPALGYARPDVGHVDLVPGDRVLLASDGLTDDVDDALVARLLGVASIDEAVELLLAAALAAGGRDNITCVVADVVDVPAVRRDDGYHVGAAAFSTIFREAATAS